MPVAQSGRSSAYNTDYGDVAPRAALAWNPSFDSGVLGKVLGNRKTVFRGGFGIYYSRLSSEDTVVTPGLTAGFSSSITTGAHHLRRIRRTGHRLQRHIIEPGAERVPHRPGWQHPDSHVPRKPSQARMFPPDNYSELISFGIDPNIKLPRIYTGDFTIQRNLGHGMFLEAAWNGRYGRSLISNVGLGASPYMFKDTASGQTFAQAYDAVANQLRAGQAVTAQPWFENQLPATEQ